MYMGTKKHDKNRVKFTEDCYLFIYSFYSDHTDIYQKKERVLRQKSNESSFNAGQCNITSGLI